MKKKYETIIFVQTLVPVLVMTFLLSMTAMAQSANEPPRTWVITDLSPVNQDKDDQATLSAFLLLLDLFDLKGITVGSINRKDVECGRSAKYVKDTFGAAYGAEVDNLNRLGNFPVELNILQSSSCEMKYNRTTNYNINDFPSTLAVIKEARKGPLFVLNWGRTFESALMVNYLISTGETSTLKNLTFINHWTYPFDDTNCNADRDACDYLHEMAKRGTIALYELGPMGQYGLFRNDCCSIIMDREKIMDSKIGAFMDLTWHDAQGMPDISDGSTFLVLAGWGGGLSSLKPDGSYDPDGLERLCLDRKEILPLLEKRAQIAAGKKLPGQTNIE